MDGGSTRNEYDEHRGRYHVTEQGPILLEFSWGTWEWPHSLDWFSAGVGTDEPQKNPRPATSAVAGGELIASFLVTGSPHLLNTPLIMPESLHSHLCIRHTCLHLSPSSRSFAGMERLVQA